MKAFTKQILPGLTAILILGAAESPLWAHCDGLDGPVVMAAKNALATENIDHVLIWVRASDETEIKAAFEKTLAVRALNEQARELADRYFFETVVRIHRAGEGAPYTGLKPAGRDLGPAIPAADQAIAKGSIEPLIGMINDAVEDGLHKTFHAVKARKGFEPDNVTGGRDFVQSYVVFIHYVEKLYEAAAATKGGHMQEADES